MFEALHKGGYIKHEGVTAQAIREIVKYYGAQIEKPELEAHDLRRRLAKPAHKGSAGLDQIQLSLSHASIKTTENIRGLSETYRRTQRPLGD